ncbi:MAG: zf-HC2 domain-containing protein [Candidatus Eremiobacteraeota bacterium]|nr:zf-HC2 domain-containing protein [Candidatus Eremiobacteraeota bacterium]
MRCSSCEPLLDAYLEGTLDRRRQRSVSAHLRACAACAEFMEELRVVDALLTTAKSPHLPTNITPAVVSATRCAAPHAPRRFPVGLLLLLYLCAAWAAAFALLRGGAVTGLASVTFAHASRDLAALSAAAHALAPATPLAAAAVTAVLLVDMLLLAAMLYGYRRLRLFAIFGGIVAAVALFTAPASADPQAVFHGGTYFGSVVVEPGQVVDGDLTVIFGDATVAGVVEGDINIVGGNYDLRPGGIVTGQVNQLGGAVTQAVVPWAPAEAPYNPFVPDHRLLWRLSWNLLALLVFLIFPLRTRMVLDRLETHPGLSVMAGLFGCVAVIPLAVLLAITILLIPLILLELVFLLAGIFLGTAALALLIGRRLCELISPATTPSPLVALLVGLALVTAAELVPVVGTLVLILVGLIGLGATILSFAGHSITEQISGPPMAAS